MRIHLVINVSWIVWYKEQVEEQKKKEGKPVEVEGVEEQEVEKILNKKKIRGVEKYLVWQKGFMAEGDTWKRKENLKNTEEALEEFKGRMSVEVRRQERIDMAEERDFRREELQGKFTAKMLYGWDDGKFEDKYLKKLERNWRRQKNDRQIDENEHLKNIEEKMEEENEKIKNRDWRTEHFSGGEILRGG